MGGLIRIQDGVINIQVNSVRPGGPVLGVVLNPAMLGERKVRGGGGAQATICKVRAAEQGGAERAGAGVVRVKCENPCKASGNRGNVGEGNVG